MDANTRRSYIAHIHAGRYQSQSSGMRNQEEHFEGRSQGPGADSGGLLPSSHSVCVFGNLLQFNLHGCNYVHSLSH